MTKDERGIERKREVERDEEEAFEWLEQVRSYQDTHVFWGWYVIVVLKWLVKQVKKSNKE